MAYQKQTWRDYDDAKTELQNVNNGAVVTPERLNHIENGIANSADKAEVTAQLQQTEGAVNQRVDNLILESGGDSNLEVTDARASTTKSETFSTLGARLTDIEKYATVMAENVLKNGNFSEGATGWLYDYATVTTQANVATLTGTGTNANPVIRQTFPAISGNVFVKGKFRVNDPNAVAVSVFMGLTELRFNRGELQEGQWMDFTRIINVSGMARLNVMLRYTKAALAVGSLDVADLMVVPITPVMAPAVGVKDEMLNLLNQYPGNRFEGKVNLFDARSWLKKLTQGSSDGGITWLSDFGVRGDGVADETDTIQEALNTGGIILLNPGTFKITKTLKIKSNTSLIGFGEQTKFVLGDNYNLTPYAWRADQIDLPNYHPYFVTEVGADNIELKSFVVEGNKTQFTDQVQVGIALERSSNVKVKNVRVSNVNYHPTQAPPRPSGQFRTGWNFLVIRSSDVDVEGGVFEYGGYEVFRVGDGCNRVKLHHAKLQYGWRTCFQILRDNRNIEISDCIINQDDFGTNDTHAAITLHSATTGYIEDVLIKGNIITAKLFLDQPNGGSSISFVDSYTKGVQLIGNKIVSNGFGMSPRTIGDLIVSDSTIDSGQIGVSATVSNAKRIKIKNNTVIAGATYSIQVSGTDAESVKILDNDVRGFGMRTSHTANGQLEIAKNKIQCAGIGVNLGASILETLAIRDNAIESTTDHGIYMNDINAKLVRVKENTLKPAVGKNGIHATVNAKMDNGWFLENGITQGLYGISLDTSIVGCIIAHNIMPTTTVGVLANADNLINNNIVPV